MGIPGFNSWFLANNKQAYIPLSQVQCSHLYLDMNSILHNCLRKAHSYDKFHALLHKRLDAIMRSVNPQKSVMLAIDGPAPLAKLITQRERRKKSFSSEERKKGRQGQGGGSGKGRPASVVSSTALTPGTPFMHDVCVSCLYYVCARLANRKWQHLEFEVSGPTVAGEGEVKILGRLARPRHPAAVSPSDTHVIVGDDADLILMALVSMTPRLHILNAALSDNVLSPSTSVMSVDRLHSLWLSSGLAGTAAAAAGVGPQAQQQLQGQQLPQEVLLGLLGAKADLALLAIMSNGNDYLPPVKGAVKLETLWASYVRIRKRPEFAGSSIITMVPLPPGSQGANGLGCMRELSVVAELDTVMLSEVLGAAIDGFKKHFAKADRPGTGSSRSGSSSSSTGLSREAADAIPWLKGALWTMSMYFAGDCPDYRWTYEGGHATVTGLHDLAEAAAAGSSSSQHHRLTLGSFQLPGGSGGDGSGSGGEWRRAIAAAAARLGVAGGGRCDPMLPHVCSLALLPAGAQEHVPQAVQRLMCEGSPIFDMYETCDACDAAAEDCYNAQRAYNNAMELSKQADAKVAELQEQQQEPPPELLQQQQDAAVAKSRALELLHAAQDRRRQHEVSGHPEGLDTFHLERLEAAVDSVPAGEYTGSQKALSQLSHSMLLRMERTGQQQQYGGGGGRFGGQYGQQQQQYGRPAGTLRPFRPPPPPVERFGPAFSRSYGGGPGGGLIVQRSLLVETAHTCRLQEDRDLWRYSSYLVLGSQAAEAAGAAAAVAAAGGGADAAGHAHKRKHEEQQAQGAAAAAAAAAASNSAAAVALKSALAAGRPPPRLVPTHLIGAPAAAAKPQQPQQPQQQQQQQGAMIAAAVAAAAAAEHAHATAAQVVATQQAADAAARAASAAAAALASSSLKAAGSTAQKPQQQQQQPGKGQGKQQRRKNSPSPQLQQGQQGQGQQAKAAAAVPQAAGGDPDSAGSGKRKKKKSPAPPAAPPAAAGGAAAAGAAAPGKPRPGFAGVAGGAFAVGPPPPPAPKTLPLPSGLLGRAASSSSIGSAGSMGGGGGGGSGLAAMDAAVTQSQQQQQQQQQQAPPAGAYSPGSAADFVYRRQQQPTLPLPAAAPPAAPLPPSYPGGPAQGQPPYHYYQQQQPQLLRPASPGYQYPGPAAGGAGGGSSGGGGSGLLGAPYNPMRPPPLPVPGPPGAVGGGGGGAGVFGGGIGRSAYPGMM